ncbi:sugar phosphate isomerase/epimerase, partial [Paenibacillus sepulcri]|nr:sugar phosphate isomerase/epimerase [Paenibacillus sepulcri]
KESTGEFENFKRMLPMAAELGASLFRVQQGGPNGFLAQDYHYRKAAYFIDRCAEEAEAYGIRVALEIHNQSILETTDDCKRLLQYIRQDNVGFIHDAGNMYITDTDYGRESVLQLGSRLLHVHVKDELRIAEAGAAGSFNNLTRHGEEA